MPANIQQLESIHRLENDIERQTDTVKDLKLQRKDTIADLPEAQQVAELTQKLTKARQELKSAIASDKDLAVLQSELDEATWKLKDLKEILSLHLVIYSRDSGREVVQDANQTTRQIVLKAKLGGRVLDQDRLPLGDPLQ